jgi:DNA repair protein RadC
MNTFTSQQQRTVELLARFFGDDAASLYEVHHRSLHALAGYARGSRLPESAAFVAGLELARELLGEQLRTQPMMDSPAIVKDYLVLHFAGQPYESFVVLYLTAQHSLIASEEVFRGTLTQTAVYPREIVKQALHHNAAAVMFAHPHPSGVAEPSRADEQLTQTLRSALALVEVRVLDHLVVAGSSVVSFAQRGLL